MASNYSILGGAGGDDIGLQGEHQKYEEFVSSKSFEHACNHLGSILYSFGSFR